MWWDDLHRNHHLMVVNQMQFSHVRQSFSWSNIEPEQRDLALSDAERYIWWQADAMMDDIEDKGVQVVARLDGAPAWAIKSTVAYDEPPFDMERLEMYCAAVATRYRGRIDAYQIWNEPNLDREWGKHPPSAVAYAKLLAACSQAIRIADPDAIIISAGLSPTGTRSREVLPDEEYLWRLYAVDGFADSFDVLGVHAPGFGHPPEISPSEVVAEGGLRWQSFRHVENIRAIMVANGDAETQIAITETGWTIDPRPDSPYNWFAVTAEQQADYLARAYAYAAAHWRPWVGLMVTLYLPDPFWTEEDEQYWWAIGTPTRPPWILDVRPAYAALLEMRKISTNPDFDHPARDKFGHPIEPDESRPNEE
jgi:hypothetical protein